MKAVIDARGVREGMTGVGRYTSHLCEALVAARPADSFVFLALRGQDKALRPPAIARAANAEWLEVDVDYESHPSGDWWEHRALPRLLDELGADVFHGPSFLIPFGRRRPKAARVVTIHDLSTFTVPHGYPLKFRIYLRWIIKRGLLTADRVICASDSARRNAQRFFPGVPTTRFDIIPHAPAEIFGPAPPGGAQADPLPCDLPESPCLLMVGTFETRKNPPFFVGLYEELTRRLGDSVPPLVWVGRRGHGARRALSALEPLRRRGLFRLYDSVAFPELPAFYHRASALVYPSLHEGFGLPVVEAMACGLPVVAADTASLPEVVGDGGWRLPLRDPKAWASVIETLLTDSQARAQAGQRAIERSRAFSWRRTAELTFASYEKAAAR